MVMNMNMQTTMKKPTDCYTLANGLQIPCLGFGTYLTPAGEVTFNSVAEALRLGYRHVDTAAFYENEADVGAAVRASGIPREEIFLTTKLWNSDHGYDNTMRAFEKSLRALGTDYLDLYLIHWPTDASQSEDWDSINRSTWRAMTELYLAGRIKSIGVSNFMPRHLRSLIESEVPPMVNQIKVHPAFLQPETMRVCRENNILMQAWSPLGRGTVLDHPALSAIAAKHGKTTAQVCIRWCLQCGMLPLPKSVTPVRIAENLDVFDFALTDAEMAEITALPFCGSTPNRMPDRMTFQ